MEQRISPLTYVFAVLVALGVLLGMAVTTPHDRYHRYQRLDAVTTRKADWIYERLHFDSAPVDVALIGTSRMGAGLSAPRLEQLYCEATGRRIHVANLSVPETGRNMHYALAKEAMRAKSPALVIVELNETEPRKPHDGFVFIADAPDILTAPALINLNYVSDLIRLPGRQTQLFFDGLRGRAEVKKTFNPALYQGSHLDRTQQLKTIDGHVISRNVTIDREKLETLKNRRLQSQKPTYMLPGFLRPLEYRYSRHYLRMIEGLANKTGAQSAYVYLPSYKAPQAFPENIKQALEIDSPALSANGGISEDPLLWLDATHVNADGADRQTTRFARSLAKAFPALGAADTCGEAGA